jgi:hypothetical protein
VRPTPLALQTPLPAPVARRQQWRVRPLRLHVRKRIFRCRAGLLVADQSVDPGVGDFDGNFVRAWFECAGCIDARGRMPDDAERLIITVGHLDLGLAK